MEYRDTNTPVKHKNHAEVLGEAQGMAAWFPDYLYGVIDEPCDLPQLTRERLVRQFGEGDSREQIEKIRDSFIAFDEVHQANLGLYFCGYPSSALDAFADPETPLEVSVALLDEQFPLPEQVDTKNRMAVYRDEDRESSPLINRKRFAAPAMKGLVTPPRRATNISSSWRVSGQSVTDTDSSLVWRDDALCAQVDPEAFFPEKGGSTRDAKKICDSCEVRGECLKYALENEEQFGVWGGLSAKERRKLKDQGA